MNRPRAARIRLLYLIPLCAWMAVSDAAAAKPHPKSVRIVYLVSADRPVREDFRKGIETAAKDLQAWYARQLGGPTFRLNDPVAEVVKADIAHFCCFDDLDVGNDLTTTAVRAFLLAHGCSFRLITSTPDSCSLDTNRRRLAP